MPLAWQWASASHAMLRIPQIHSCERRCFGNNYPERQIEQPIFTLGTPTIARAAKNLRAMADCLAGIGYWPLSSGADIRRSLRERPELVGSCPRAPTHPNGCYPVLDALKPPFRSPT
jgi:hypothetical protein